MLISCTKNLVVPNSFCFLFPDSRTQTGFDRNCCFCTDSAVCRSKIELDQVKRVQDAAGRQQIKINNERRRTTKRGAREGKRGNFKPQTKIREGRTRRWLSDAVNEGHVPCWAVLNKNSCLGEE